MKTYLLQSSRVKEVFAFRKGAASPALMFILIMNVIFLALFWSFNDQVFPQIRPPTLFSTLETSLLILDVLLFLANYFFLFSSKFLDGITSLKKIYSPLPAPNGAPNPKPSFFLLLLLLFFSSIFHFLGFLFFLFLIFSGWIICSTWIFSKIFFIILSATPLFPDIVSFEISFLSGFALFLLLALLPQFIYFRMDNNGRRRIDKVFENYIYA